jgi:large repetitive protein
VTCTASDTKNNSATTSFTITVRDTTAPQLTCPAPLTVRATEAGGVTANFTGASATDLVSSSLVVRYSPASGAMLPVGDTEVEASATDEAGNTGRCTFTVTVLPPPFSEDPGGVDGPDSGCGCGATPGASAALWGLVVLGARLVRRRRVAGGAIEW